MGEARRKRAEWIQLYDPDKPARFAISRPSMRPSSTRRFESGLAADIARARAAGLPKLCCNLDCDTELHTLPEVLAFLKASDDPSVPPIAMGVCAQCAELGDEGLREILRRAANQYGFGEPPKNGAQVEIKLMTCQFSAGGVPLAIAWNGELGDSMECTLAGEFAELLERRLLPRLVAFRNGIGNCHSIVDHLHLDLKELGIADRFSFLRGGSELLKSEADPQGLHSWIECDGWAIDAANGGGRPVLFIPIADYRAQMEFTNTQILHSPEK